MNTTCRMCKVELWLSDDDAGTDKEVDRLCDKCLNEINEAIQKEHEDHLSQEAKSQNTGY